MFFFFLYAYRFDNAPVFIIRFRYAFIICILAAVVSTRYYYYYNVIWVRTAERTLVFSAFVFRDVLLHYAFFFHGVTHVGRRWITRRFVHYSMPDVHAHIIGRYYIIIHFFFFTFVVTVYRCKCVRQTANVAFARRPGRWLLAALIYIMLNGPHEFFFLKNYKFPTIVRQIIH